MKGLEHVMDDDGITDPGMVDLLEIYHARQVLDALDAQLNRLSAYDQHLCVAELARKRDIARFYQAMLQTMAEFLQQLGDSHPIPERP